MRTNLSSIAGFMIFPRREIENGRERVAFYTATTQWGKVVEGTEKLLFFVDPAGLFAADGNYFHNDMELTEPVDNTPPQKLEDEEDEHGNLPDDPAYGSGMSAEDFSRHCDEMERADSMGAALATAPPTPVPGKNALRVLRERRIAGELFAEPDDIVYPCTKADYGCASDDTRGLGVEHISVTKDRNGDYPFFTIPVDDVERYHG